MTRPDQNTVIRRYRPEDQAQVEGLVTRSLAELGFAVDPVLDADLVDPGAAYLAAWVAIDAGEACDGSGRDSGGRIVGSVAIRELAGDHPEEPERVAELKRMFLSPAFRRQGLGRQLLDVALAWAKEAGFEWVRLDTGLSMEAAQRFYEAQGFERCGSRVEAGAGEARCEVLYRRRL